MTALLDFLEMAGWLFILPISLTLGLFFGVPWLIGILLGAPG